MNSDKTGSAANSGGTSGNAPQKPNRNGHPSAHDPAKSPTSESDYLTRQAEEAQQAMSRVMQEMAEKLKEGVDVKAWMQQYPWVALGIGAAAGFATASALTPSREESFNERLKSLFPERLVQLDQGTAAAYQAQNPGAQPPKPGMMANITASLFDALKTALVSTLSSAVTAQVHKDTGEGHSGEPTRDPTAPA